MFHDGSWISIEPIDDLESLLVPGVPQSLLDQILELWFVGEFPEELGGRVVLHRTEEAVDDGLYLRLGIVEVSAHAHQHRLSSVQPPVQLRVRNLDGSGVQDDRTVEAEVIGDDHGEVGLADAGTDDVDRTGDS